MRRLAAIAAILVAGAGATAAAAEPAVASGWWSRPLLAPDVDDSSLLVAGSPDTPTAYGALVADVASTAGGVELRLDVVPGSVSLPTSELRLCPIDPTEFAPAAGGSMDDAPAYDCESPVPGVFDDARGSVSFAVDDVVVDGRLAAAIVPAGPLTRLVLAAPDAGSLTVGPEGEQRPEPPPSPGSAAPQLPAAAAPTTSDGLPVAPAARRRAAVPVPASSPAPMGAAPAVSTAALPALAAGEAGRGILAAAGLCAAMGGLWTAARRVRYA